jgi:group I intron endonuclease
MNENDCILLIGCIYLITNIINKKQYVGQSIYKDPNDRYQSHWYDALKRKDNMILHTAMRKYGPDNFKVELLCICSYDKLRVYFFILDTYFVTGCGSIL